MNPAIAFAIQFFWFLIAWATIAKVFVGPAIARLDTNDRLAICLVPQMFRVLGVGLLVPNLAPNLPHDFALHTAIGDSLTAVLALLAIIALHKRWPSARVLALACSIVGSVDLAIAMSHAAAIKAALYLTAQWYVPAMGVPLMIVSHAMAWRVLLGQRS